MVDVISEGFQIQSIYFMKVIFWLNTSYGGSIPEVIGWNVFDALVTALYLLLGVTCCCFHLLRNALRLSVLTSACGLCPYVCREPWKCPEAFTVTLVEQRAEVRSLRAEEGNIHILITLLEPQNMEIQQQ